MLTYMIVGGCFLSGKYRFIEAGKKAVANRLLDPKAAEFRDIKAYIDEKDEVLCGEVNGKNRFGAYTGFNKFAATRFVLSDLDHWIVAFDTEQKEEHETYTRVSKNCGKAS